MRSLTMAKRFSPPHTTDANGRRRPGDRLEDYSKAELVAQLQFLRQSFGSSAASITDLNNYREEVRIQADELIKTQALLEQSRDWFAALFDFAPVPYITLDQ